MESTPLSSDWTELLAAFNAAGVKYLVVGAHAYARYAAPRATGDLDLWIERSPENARRTFETLAAFGAPLDDLRLEDFEAADVVYMFGRPPLRIDILTGIDGVTFEEAWSSRVDGSLGGVPVAFIGRDAFLQNKRAAGRTKDLADAEAVERFKTKP
ncbi:MAG TPA: hypothetical protein VNG31_05110 [Candidatus Baltobacteraceae bacterium]|nr:hypothetical protein [Candidatus Baltobacteraceae bacterium]